MFEKNYEKSILRVGCEWWNQEESTKWANGIARLSDNLSAAFAETDVNFTQTIVAKAGLRFEYSSLLKQAVVMLRLATHIKTGKTSQVSMAYGTFFQKPEWAAKTLDHN